MNRIQCVKWIIRSLAWGAVITASSTAAQGIRFFVECHSSGSASNDSSQVYGYRLRAYGFPQRVQDSIHIQLDEQNLLLSVDSKQAGQEESNPLYTDMPLVKRAEQPCDNGQCQNVNYEPKDFQGTLIVTYDPDRGSISIKHEIEPNKVIASRGGCLFVGLPARNVEVP